MFENDQNVIDILLQNDAEFISMYNKYTGIKKQIQDFHDGNHSLHENVLEKLKKEKLLLKDKMSVIIEGYKDTQNTS